MSAQIVYYWPLLICLDFIQVQFLPLNCFRRSVKLATLLRAISPGYFRLGGTSANWLFYGIPSPKLKSLGYPKANLMTGLLLLLINVVTNPYQFITN